MTDYDSKRKWLFTFMLLLITVVYAVLSQFVWQSKAGDILLGALVGWNSLTIQFFFRKAAPEIPDIPDVTK
jgi:hypothetical protein